MFTQFSLFGVIMWCQLDYLLFVVYTYCTHFEKLRRNCVRITMQYMKYCHCNCSGFVHIQFRKHTVGLTFWEFQKMKLVHAWKWRGKETLSFHLQDSIFIVQNTHPASSKPVVQSNIDFSPPKNLTAFLYFSSRQVIFQWMSNIMAEKY